MNAEDDEERDRLVPVALVLVGLLGISIVLWAAGDPPEPIDFGSEPIDRIDCSWVEDIDVRRSFRNTVGVLEAEIGIDAASMLDDPRIGFDPTHVWLHIDVEQGARSRGYEQRLSPTGLSADQGSSEVTVRFDAIQDPSVPDVRCRATVVVS